MFSLTQVKQRGGCDKGHKENSRGKWNHANQDDHHITEAATKRHNTEVTSDEYHAACSIPITHLEEERDREKTEIKINKIILLIDLEL